MTTPVDKPTKGKEEATNKLNYVLVMNDKIIEKLLVAIKNS